MDPSSLIVGGLLFASLLMWLVALVRQRSGAEAMFPFNPWRRVVPGVAFASAVLLVGMFQAAALAAHLSTPKAAAEKIVLPDPVGPPTDPGNVPDNPAAPVPVSIEGVQGMLLLDLGIAALLGSLIRFQSSHRFERRAVLMASSVAGGPVKSPEDASGERDSGSSLPDALKGEDGNRSMLQQRARLGGLPHLSQRLARVWREEAALVFTHAMRGFQLAIGPVFLILIVSQFLGLRTEETQHEFLQLLVHEGSAGAWFWVAVTAVLAAPLAEELLYRTALQGWLEPRLTPIPAILVSSVVFALAHNFPDSIALIPLALVLGYVYYRRQSYWTVVVIHALFNGLNLLLTAMAEQPTGM
jgi:membrane protease YdiL (CAAX protease family)